ncbi:16056_t:CDS:2 [Funneliformis geosporum]|uniref:4451_t:CDS:1 n=1 Tax=Funneliformis geosporum TaxID=1117311 RepID=A0A9W4SEL9_9GLOM|nr:16056_t:CDS:2 [Funneliformis geosporum]CAI2166768.1 4451_t:CDS:2 [Funneliformis geosporum]
MLKMKSGPANVNEQVCDLTDEHMSFRINIRMIYRQYVNFMSLAILIQCRHNIAINDLSDSMITPTIKSKPTSKAKNGYRMVMTFAFIKIITMPLHTLVPLGFMDNVNRDFKDILQNIASRLQYNSTFS